MTIRRVAIAVVVAAMAAACSGGTADSPTEAGGGVDQPTSGSGTGGGSGAGDATLHAAWTIGPTTFDPHRSDACTICNKVYNYPVYDRLIYLTADLQLEPMLATSWEFTDEGNFRMELRSGVNFHDGTPFDAEAVRANIERGQTLPESTIIRDQLSVITGVTVVDEDTVEFELDRPAANLPYILADLAGSMISPTAFDSDLESEPVGTGPYRLVEATFGDTGSAIFERVDGYWDPEAQKPARIEILGIPDDATRMNALESGEIDAGNVKSVSRDRALSLAESPEYELTDFSTVSWLSVFLNTSRAPFDDVDVRRALWHALDRQALSDAIDGGSCTVTDQIYPEGSPGHDPGIAGYTFDPEESKRLLETAGYADGLDLRVLVLGAAPWNNYAVAMQPMMEAAGFTVTLEERAGGDADRAWAEEGDQFDAFVAVKDAAADPGTTFQLELPPYNPGGVSEEIQRMAEDAGDGRLPVDEQAQLWQEVAASVTEEAYEVPICFPFFGYAHRSTVTGVEHNSLGPYLALDVRYFDISAE